jgi:heptaprenyl diphosphate synthase
VSTARREKSGRPGPLDVVFDDPALEAAVRTGLDQVESALRTAVRAEDDFVASAASYLVAAGGKRFRPLVSLLAAQFGDASRPEIIPAAVVVEITHLATLYHDDVMDEAAVRRGAESANSRWDNTVAILTGDFLFSRASNLLADLGPWAVRLQAQTFERLVTGQIRETVGPAPGTDPVDHYLAVLGDKTGSLIATAAEFGAQFAGVAAPIIATLRDFAEQVGVAFQISDDILDIASESMQSGKTPGTDLREGIPTLPVLYALRRGDAAAGRLRELLDTGLVDDGLLAEALRLLRASSAMDEARAVLHSYAARARVTLDAVPDMPARGAFLALTDTVIERTG